MGCAELCSCSFGQHAGLPSREHFRLFPDTGKRDVQPFPLCAETFAYFLFKTEVMPSVNDQCCSCARFFLFLLMQFLDPVVKFTSLCFVPIFEKLSCTRARRSLNLLKTAKMNRKTTIEAHQRNTQESNILEKEHVHFRRKKTRIL